MLRVSTNKKISILRIKSVDIPSNFKDSFSIGDVKKQTALINEISMKLDNTQNIPSFPILSYSWKCSNNGNDPWLKQ